MRRGARSRAPLMGTATRPRLAVRRSNRYFYAQLIDDVKGHTLLSASSAVLTKAGSKTTKVATAFSVGEELGKKAAEKGIKKVIFDRGSYKFHGRVKSFADGIKKGGLII